LSKSPVEKLDSVAVRRAEMAEVVLVVIEGGGVWEVHKVAKQVVILVEEKKVAAQEAVSEAAVRAVA